MKPAAPYLPVVLLAGLLLGACDRLGFPDPAVVAANAEAEGKAIGAACRNSGRGLEDCYQNNPKAQKSAVFAGWKDMNEYMSQNKMEVSAPPPPPPKKAEAEEEKALEGGHGKEADKEKPEKGAKEPKEAKPAKNLKHG